MAVESQLIRGVFGAVVGHYGDAVGAERVQEVQACRADVKHTVTEVRQSKRQGYCQSLITA